jgi:uncharacterized membrane protein YkoI
MMSPRRLILVTAALCGLALFPVAQAEAQKGPESKLPEAVRKTFDAKFPKAQIQKVDVEEEDGVMVYDVEFKDAQGEKETDITADGTMLEITYVIQPKDLPEAAAKPMLKAAEGATKGRTERIEITHQTKDGKAVKLSRPVTHYAMEMTKGGNTAEIVVDSEGKVLEEPKWSAEK